MNSPGAVRAVTNLAAAFGKRLSSERFQFYADKLGRWDLTEQSWARVTSRIVADMDTFPAISQVIGYLKSAMREQGNLGDVEPVWETWRDQDRRTYARASGKFRSLVPSPQIIDECESCPINEGRRAFIEAFAGAGGNINRLDEILLALRTSRGK